MEQGVLMRVANDWGVYLCKKGVNLKLHHFLTCDLTATHRANEALYVASVRSASAGVGPHSRWVCLTSNLLVATHSTASMTLSIHTHARRTRAGCMCMGER